MGYHFARTMQPSTDLTQVETWQDETAEATGLLIRDKRIPIPVLKQVDAALKRLQLGASLNGKEIAQILKLLETVNQVVAFFDHEREEDEGITYPVLAFWYDQLVVIKSLNTQLKLAVDEEGRVLSTASDQLASIRRRQQQAEEQIRTQLNQLLRSRANQLSDSIITIRNNRYVLPVKSEFRNNFGGTIHDQSATGQTVYIEPQTVISLNNRRTSLQAEERQEIERILWELSRALMPYTEQIKKNQKVLGQLDFIQARAQYGRSINAVKPTFSIDQHVSIWQARHPLIAADEIVANDIIIGQEYRHLIITGPNTGGKTILLKTLGLLQIMGQSGLHIPADDHSQLGLFDEVFADIGDEQSIEQSLSTFSSHMTNIVRIVDQANADSLILLDELGSGTDPQEGASLAIAILDYLHKVGATVMATTHYPELKVYAHDAKETMNASMEFNADTLSPTYRLLIGIPGRSNALDISRRLGLRSDILATAREGLTDSSQSLDEMVAQLERDRRQAEKTTQAANQKLQEADQLYQDLRTEYNRWLNQKQIIIEKAKKEANKKVEMIQAQADKLMSEIRDMQLEQGQATIKEHELIEKRKQFEKLKQQSSLKNNKVLKAAKQKREIQVGDDVEVLTYGQRGTVVEKLDNNTFTVQMGILKMNVDRKDLNLLKKEEPKTKVNLQRRATSSKVLTSLDLRGERYDAAMSRLEQYLDQALLSHHPKVTIIHGKGTGAIRDGVQKVLRKHPQVDHFNFSPPNAGGNGSTEVYFK